MKGFFGHLGEASGQKIIKKNHLLRTYIVDFVRKVIDYSDILQHGCCFRLRLSKSQIVEIRSKFY